MENELKDLWRLNTSEVEVSDKKIDEIISYKSTNIISRIIKTMKVEHYMNIIAFPIFFISLIYFSMLVEAILTVVVFVPFLWYYQTLLNKLNKAKIQLSVHDYLLACYENLQVFVAHYKIASVFLVAIAFFVTTRATWSESIDHKILNSEGEINISYLLSIAIGLAFSIGSMLMIIHLLYGRKMKILKSMIEELEN
ncbi:hypothetical protein JKA74_15370 [Marivirga sp. S37H4]|uniref:Uncharacterized protein n=1 Tax=Marivirga aurantiaca TaxID=2802615 RepID=A0A935CAA0_9BACT|nr:hypothetical protein [Marivirga aurantiaca]MBK6266424.1 hypothetical protein [Marivirga aurantiaca]